MINFYNRNSNIYFPKYPVFNQLGQMFLLQFKQFSPWSDKGENKPKESFLN